jgi:hypothetical protein
MQRFSAFLSRMPTHRALLVRCAPLLIAAVWLSGLPRGAQAADELPGTGLHAGWQARLGGSDRSVAEPGLQRDSLSLFGDYYFATPGLASTTSLRGGFRATGGVFVGPRSGLGLAAPAAWPGVAAPVASRGFGLSVPEAGRAPYASGDSNSVPYVGVGYSGLKALRATGGGWAFSADLGVMALQPRSSVRLGQQPVQDIWRELQFSPLLQVGASYTF